LIKPGLIAGSLNAVDNTFEILTSKR